MPKIVEDDDAPERASEQPVERADDGLPKHFRPYVHHGVELHEKGDGNGYGDCPFCGREGKFSVRADNGVWRCFVCNQGNEKGGGNAVVFLRKLHEISMNGADLVEDLAADRGLPVEVLRAWGVRTSATTGEILVPGFGADGKLNQLYKYMGFGGDGERTLIPTPTLGHQVHMVPGDLMRKPRRVLYVCEGPWDGMALWWALRSFRVDADGRTVRTGNPSASMMNDSMVIAVPGCGAVGKPMERWLPLAARTRTILMFDSDQPREKNGKTVAPAGYEAARRAAGILATAEDPPGVVHWLRWGDGGFDPQLDDGHDVRDHLTGFDDPRDQASMLEDLLGRVEAIPEAWVANRTAQAAARGAVELECIPCTSWREAVAKWQRAMKWTDGLDRALAVMLASVISTRAVGDQLWVKIVGPAACGKSTLCEALAVNKKYIKANSTMRGFHSGFQVDKEGKEDNSLIAQLYDKTLVTKDGDTLMKSPNVEQILSEARDVYDRVSRTHYRNKMSRDYEGVNMTWILCGTSSIRAMDASELGERFLDCVVMEDIDEETEDMILIKVANRADRNMAFEAGSGKDASDDPDLTLAKQLTGGYVTYLRENARELLSAVQIDQDMLMRCIQLGKFVAYMRARPSKNSDEAAEREFATRLVSQLTRLAKCLCAVLNRTRMDDEVLRRVRTVALDTARGDTLNIVRAIRAGGEKGVVVRELAIRTHQTDARLRELLRFLRRIRVCEIHAEQGKTGSVVRWKLTERFGHLLDDVVEAGG